MAHLAGQSQPGLRRHLHADRRPIEDRRHLDGSPSHDRQRADPTRAIGFTLPHEHTGIYLWHIPNRWDYWELTPDEDLIADELRDFRRRGGSTLVELTLPGVGRDPERLRRLASRTGVQIVMGCGWYREAYYPPEARIDRRSVDDLAAELIGELRDGVARHGRAAGDHRRDRDRQAVGQRPRGAGASGRRPRRARDRHGDHAPTACRSPVALAQLRIFEEEGVDPARVVIGHADSYPVLDHYLAILDRGANLQFDFLGHRFQTEEAEEPRLVEHIVELLERGCGRQLLLSQDVCHNSQLKAQGGFGYTYLQQHFLPTLRTAAVGEGEIAADDDRQPAPHPDASR